jgi:hypothetical protein
MAGYDAATGFSQQRYAALSPIPHVAKRSPIEPSYRKTIQSWTGLVAEP